MTKIKENFILGNKKSDNSSKWKKYLQDSYILLFKSIVFSEPLKKKNTWTQLFFASISFDCIKRNCIK